MVDGGFAKSASMSSGLLPRNSNLSKERKSGGAARAVMTPAYLSAIFIPIRMSSSSALQQIDAFLSAGDYYSAHQKALTTATRLLAPPRRGPAPKPSAEGGFLPYDAKAEEAAELLWTSSRRLLEKAQKGSGAELASRLVDVWKTRGVKCSQQERGEQVRCTCVHATGDHDHVGEEPVRWTQTSVERAFLPYCTKYSTALALELIHVLHTTAKIIQLIALMGPSGSWRKQLTDAVFSYVSRVSLLAGTFGS